MKEDEEDTKIFINMIKESAENLGLLPDMNFDDLLKDQKFNESYKNLVYRLLPKLLLMFIDTNLYDANMQIVLGDNTIRFFTSLEDLIQQARKKNEEKTNSLISYFLLIPAIHHLKVPEGRSLTASTLMEEEILNGSNKLQNSEQKVSDFFDDLGTMLTSVKQKSDKLLKISRRFEKEFDNYVNLIKNNYETARYILGLLLGLFDILDKSSSQQVSRYFSKKQTPAFLYFGPNLRRYAYGRIFWLKDYLFVPKYKKNYISIKVLEMPYFEITA